jgi:hypothetical protein
MSELQTALAYRDYAIARIEHDSPNPDPKLIANLGEVCLVLHQLGEEA